MISSKELKRLAREKLAGNYRITMGALLITLAMPMIIEFPFSGLIASENPSPIQIGIYYIAEILITILTGVLKIGTYSVHLKVARKQEVTPNHVFTCFKSQTDKYIIGYIPYFIISLIASAPAYFAIKLIKKSQDINTILACASLVILTLILQIIVTLLYGLLFYVMIDRQDLSVINWYKTTRNLMKEKKGKLLYLILSFIGLELLGLLSLGIGLLWVEPYKQQTLTLFYLNATGELNETYNPYNEQTSSYSQGFNTYV